MDSCSLLRVLPGQHYDTCLFYVLCCLSLSLPLSLPPSPFLDSLCDILCPLCMQAPGARTAASCAWWTLRPDLPLHPPIVPSLH